MASPAHDPAGPASTELRVAYRGAWYPATEIARGAAYELFSRFPVDGFQPNPRGAPETAWHRFVHRSDIAAVVGPEGCGARDVPDPPVRIPLSREQGWAQVHQLTQTATGEQLPVVQAIRQTAAIGCGTRMVKVLSGRQLAGHLHGWPAYGFCYREYDIAHLRTPVQLGLLRSDPAPGGNEPGVAYALRWRAIDPVDYAAPLVTDQPGLVAMSPHDRIGPPVLGTGFTPSAQQVIPEFITRDFADLPLPANAQLVAYPGDGTEVVLYSFQPEQRGWIRMVGPQWRHLLAQVPDISPDQEYVRLTPDPVAARLVGWRQGQEFDAVADPPTQFRILAMTRAARYPVSALSRRTGYATWRGAPCTVLRAESDWLRLRLCRPEPVQVGPSAAQCVERGVYEVWAPAGDVSDHRVVDVRYPLGG